MYWDTDRSRSGAGTMPSVEPVSPEALTLRDYLAPVFNRRWLVLGIVVVFTVGTYIFASSKPTVYQASTKLYTAQEGNSLVGVGAGYSDDRAVENQATLLTSVDVARGVARQIGYKGAPADLAGSVSAVPSKGADFITITARSSSREQAARIANAFAQQFMAFRSGERRTAAQKALGTLGSQLKQFPNTASNRADRASIQAQIRQLQVALNSGAGGASQIDPARFGTSTGLGPKKKAGLAALAALAGAILLAYMLHRFDPRIRNVEAVANEYRRPILAAIFEDGEIDHFRNGVPSMSSHSIEAFRHLRTNLDLASPDRRLSTILVTSAGPGEGKTTVARNLALALHESGRRVALIDADLRKPALAPVLGVNPQYGITNVLGGRRELEEITLSISVPAPAVPAGASASANGSADRGSAITFVPAGTGTANPPALLESDAFGAIVDDIASHHDVVIIDTAPLAVVSDAVLLLGRVDAVVMVARSGITDRRGVRRALELVERVPGANFVGVVMNGLESTEAAAYGYGYGYGYGYRAPAKAPEPVARS
jgi:succinoglycan biosynthesis transport protein ExoP